MLNEMLSHLLRQPRSKERCIEWIKIVYCGYAKKEEERRAREKIRQNFKRDGYLVRHTI